MIQLTCNEVLMKDEKLFLIFYFFFRQILFVTGVFIRPLIFCKPLLRISRGLLQKGGRGWNHKKPTLNLVNKTKRANCFVDSFIAIILYIYIYIYSYIDLDLALYS